MTEIPYRKIRGAKHTWKLVRGARPHDLKRPALAIFDVIAGSEVPVTVEQIFDRMNVFRSISTIRRLLREMEAAGMVHELPQQAEIPGMTQKEKRK